MAAFKICRAALQSSFSQANIIEVGRTEQHDDLQLRPRRGIACVFIPLLHDGHIIALRISTEKLSHFIYSQRYSIGVNLDQLSTILNLTCNEDLVDITTCDEWFQFIFQIENSEGHKTCRNIEFIPPNPMHVLLDSMPHHHVLKAGDHSWSCSVDLDPLLDILDAAGDDDFVGFFALDDNDDMPLRFKLTLEKPGAEKKVLQIERNEYVIEFEDVEKEDDSPYVVLFRLKHLRSLNDSIERSNNVCIYPTYLGGPPACLSCTFDSIGEISYFFPPSS
ncbi:hypothetical protein ACOSQ2_000995 [Xanthoceras sorbifolium]